MTGDHAQNLIEIGVMLGMRAVIGLLEAGATFDEKMLRELSDYCSKAAEDMTDMPAEDFSLKVQPIVDKIMKSAGA